MCVSHCLPGGDWLHGVTSGLQFPSRRDRFSLHLEAGSVMPVTVAWHVHGSTANLEHGPLFVLVLPTSCEDMLEFFQVRVQVAGT